MFFYREQIRNVLFHLHLQWHHSGTLKIDFIFSFLICSRLKKFSDSKNIYFIA